MHKHSHKGKDRKRKERHHSPDERSSGEEASFSGDCSIESKGKRRRHTKTHDKSTQKKGHQRRQSKQSSSDGDSGHKRKHRVPETISTEDYFKRSAEFRAWLPEQQGITFSDLNSEESHRMFKKFVRHWNAGKLNEDYYKGMAAGDLAHCSQTQYQWKMHSVREDKLSCVTHKMGQWKHDSCAGIGQESAHDVLKEGLIGPSLPFTVQSDQKTDSTEEDDARVRERERIQLERKAFRKGHEMVLDELLPKETGRERRIEKKKIRSELQKEREVSPELRDPFPTEAGGSDIRARIQKIKDQREKRTHVAKDKVSEYRAKERARAQAIMELAKASKKEGALWR